ncbi:MAG: DUF3794 domain-containing protein [Clostridia bacterium]|nr:DUF3794 domain-containing protein [Clostridia bacterium]
MSTENLSNNKNLQSFKDEFCVWNEALKMSPEYDVSEEYILPDYFPDIRKILFVSAKAEENDANNQEGKAEYSGDVIFNVVYMGDTGQVKCVTQSYPYTNYISNENIYDDSIIEASTSVENRSVRAVSPRKLLLKCRVVSDISVFNKVCVSPRLVGGSGVEDEFTLERKVGKKECVNYMQFTESDIRVSEDIEYKGKTPIAEIVYSDAELFMTDCKYSDGKVDIRGNARVKCLIRCAEEGDEGEYESVEKNIPIDHSCEVKLPQNDSKCFGKLELGAIEIGVANDSYGENRLIQVDFVCRARLTGISNSDTVFTDDIFSTAYKYENTYKDVMTERLAKCGYSNFSASGSGEVSNQEGIVLNRVVFSQAFSQMKLNGVSNGKAVFDGECTVKAVLTDNEGNCMSSDMVFPIRFEIPTDCSEVKRSIVDSTVLDSRVNIDGNKLNANVEIGIDYVLYEKVTANTVTTVSIDKNIKITENKDRCVRLYYPEENEDLWSVAKKYSLSRASLERANNRQLSEGLPRVILIPTNTIK